jgi:hypothetical protein
MEELLSDRVHVSNIIKPKQHNPQNAKVDFMNLDGVVNSLQQDGPNGPKIINLVDLSSAPTPPLRTPITLRNIRQK